MPAEVPALPQDLLRALLEHVKVLDSHHIRYALIGAIAAGYHSRPRFTRDLDFLLDVPQVGLPGVLLDLEARDFRFDARTVIQEWTQQHLTVLSFHAIRIDWLKPILPVYQHVIDNARSEEWLGCSVRLASPEGLILTKLLAFRTQDQVDIESLLAANRDKLDLDLIRREWQTVAEVTDPRMIWFERAVERTGGSDGNRTVSP
jgi:hypothetical protein